jgi:hypothetical protein
MTKMTKIVLASIVGLALSTTTVSADAAKGQKLYAKFFKASCGMTGAKFAGMKKGSEWNAGSLSAELGKCKGADMTKNKPDLLDFVKAYSKDSGKVPAC